MRFVPIPPGLPGDLVRCMDDPKKVTSAKRSKAPLPGYPACVYTKAQLDSLVALGSPFLELYNYTVPLACAGVLAGTEKGGRDAVHVPRSRVVVRKRGGG